ncbi:MAG: hypothetical protein ACI88A_002857, partial [Paraglaciecola sp.]
MGINTYFSATSTIHEQHERYIPMPPQNDGFRATGVLQFKASPCRNVVYLSKGNNAEVKCPRRSLRAGFKTIYAAVT